MAFFKIDPSCRETHLKSSLMTPSPITVCGAQKVMAELLTDPFVLLLMLELLLVALAIVLFGPSRKKPELSERHDASMSLRG